MAAGNLSANCDRALIKKDNYADVGTNSFVQLPKAVSAKERERVRMTDLRKAFQKLKSRLTWVPADTKLTKCDTLYLAILYLRYLTLLAQGRKNEACQVKRRVTQGWSRHKNRYWLKRMTKETCDEK